MFVLSSSSLQIYTVSNMPFFRLREATEADCEDIAQMIKDSARLHNGSDQVTINADVLKKDGFGERPSFRCHVAEPVSQGDQAKRRLIGFMMYYFGYFSWCGRALFIEEIYVVPDFRCLKVGDSLFSSAVEVARDNDCAMLEWQIAGWNKPAMKGAMKKPGVFNWTRTGGLENFSIGKDAIKNYRFIHVPLFSKL